MNVNIISHLKKISNHFAVHFFWSEKSGFKKKIDDGRTGKAENFTFASAKIAI